MAKDLAMRNTPAYRPARRVYYQTRMNYALGEISRLAKLLDINPRQLTAMFDAGMRASELAEAVAVKLGAAVVPERD